MKKLFSLSVLLLSIVIFWSCNTNQESKETCCENEEIIITESSAHLINATLWVQQSAEFEACCFQAFNYAKIALDTRMNLANMDKPLAVVFDVDETLLDNSYYEANLIENGTSYTKETWKEWSDMECATAMPGAIEFLNYAKSKGVEIIYVSNRRENEIDHSFANMEKVGFPAVPKENYFFRTDESSKNARRAMVSEKYNIILLVGDNLADFDGAFEDRTQNMGKNVVESNKDKFGSEYIILPNPMYGKWERCLPTDETKTDTENRINALIGYDEVCN